MQKETPYPTSSTAAVVADYDKVLTNFLDPVENAMKTGNFEHVLTSSDQGLGALGFLARNEEQLRRWLEHKAPLDRDRIRAATVIAQLYFYVGTPEKAQPLLKVYADQEAEFLAREDIPLKAKLQIGELHYACRSFNSQLDVAKTLLSQCESQHDFFNMGLSFHQLARGHYRKDDFAETERYCDQAIEHLTRASTLEGLRQIDAGGTEVREQLIRVAWRMGLVLYTKGHAAWVAGNLPKAKSKLSPARFFLSATGDFVHQAQVEHDLGCIAQAEGKYHDALGHFQKADGEYRKISHTVHRARLYLNWGNAHRVGDRLSSIRNLKLARECYDEALDCARKIGEKRLTARAMTALSVLNQEDECLNLDKAYAYIEDAIKILGGMSNNRRSVLQAKFARGTCRMKRGEYTAAENFLGTALSDAWDLKVPYFEAQAHLHLAELYCDTPIRDLQKASEHYQRAGEIIDKNEAPYEVQKMFAKMRDRIFYVRRSSLVINAEDIKEDGISLKEIVGLARIWAIEMAMKKANNNKTKAAQLLNITRAGFEKVLRRTPEEE